MLDPTHEVEELRAEFLSAFESVLASGQYILGPNVAAFERECAEYLNVEHAVALNSGTDALVIALRALGVASGDEVITTAFTFFATAEAISAVGATPRFADIDRRTFNIDAESVAELIGPATKAILPVHLYGAPADMSRLRALADDNGLLLVEDCAQAFGACIGGQRVGSIGDAGAFSFFPSKNLGGFGDGGLLVSHDNKFAAQARALRAHGATQKYRNEEIGYNSRLDELQAALLRVKLPRVDTNNAKRAALAQAYDHALADIAGIVLPSRPPADASHVYHQYTIRVLDGRRDDAAAALMAQGISSMIYYPVPLHRLPVYRNHVTKPIPHAERAALEVLSLPIWPDMPPDVPVRVAAALRHLRDMRAAAHDI